MIADANAIRYALRADIMQEHNWCVKRSFARIYRQNAGSLSPEDAFSLFLTKLKVFELTMLSISI